MLPQLYPDNPLFMTTFKPCVRKQRKDGLFSVFIRLVHERAINYIMTDKTVSHQHVSKSGDITDPYVLAYCSKLILDWSDRLNRVNTSAWTVKQIANYLRTGCWADALSRAGSLVYRMILKVWVPTFTR